MPIYFRADPYPHRDMAIEQVRRPAFPWIVRVPAGTNCKELFLLLCTISVVLMVLFRVGYFPEMHHYLLSCINKRLGELIHMDPLTHASCAVLVCQSMISPAESIVPLAASIIFSQLPDLDFLTKKIGNSTLFLKVHHKMSHSLLLLAIIGIMGAAVINVAGFYDDFMRLSFVLIIVLWTHSLLDILVHSPGVALFWPFSHKMVSSSIVMGPNPLTSSARCAERKLSVCIRCQLHGSLYISLFYIMNGGAFVSLILFTQGKLFSGIVLLLSVIYIFYCLYEKKRAMRIWESLSDEGHDGFVRNSVYPGSYSPWIWFGIRENGSEIRTGYIDSRKGTIRESSRFKKQPDTLLTEQSKQTETVRDFLREAMVPYVEQFKKNSLSIVTWRELAYAFSSEAELYSAKVVFNEHNKVLAEEFRERWVDSEKWLSHIDKLNSSDMKSIHIHSHDEEPEESGKRRRR